MGRIIIAFLGVLFACAASARMPEPMLLPVDREPLVLVSRDGSRTPFDVEIADTNETRMRGLMFRTDFPQNRAMLFVMGISRPIMMWMQNTPLPLDMVFLDAKGNITAIHENAVPFSEAIISSGGPAAFVVELNAGTTRKIGLSVGGKALHRVICGACAAK